jgi:hypothetical protein
MRRFATPSRASAEGSSIARGYAMNAPFTGPQVIDLLSEAIERVRPLLNRQRSLKDRVRVLWAGAKNARGFAASEVIASEFFQLARETDLMADLDDPIRRLSGEVTIRHVVDWACRGMNPAPRVAFAVIEDAERDAAGAEVRTAKAEAIEFLQAALAGESVPAAEINRMAREHGLTAKAIRSARETLGVTIERDGFGPGSKSLWSLPKSA